MNNWKTKDKAPEDKPEEADDQAQGWHWGRRFGGRKRGTAGEGRSRADPGPAKCHRHLKLKFK